MYIDRASGKKFYKNVCPLKTYILTAPTIICMSKNIHYNVPFLVEWVIDNTPVINGSASSLESMW